MRRHGLLTLHRLCGTRMATAYTRGFSGTPKPLEFEGWGAAGRKLQCIDCHAAGEPARVVIGGLPDVSGATMAEKRLRMMQPDLDAFRRLLLLEPRGYPCQNANFVLPPTGKSTAAFGVVIAEQGHVYPAMSGHNMMCVATTLLETGMVPMVEPLTTFDLETPAGLVGIQAQCREGKAIEITLRNDMDVEIDVPELGPVKLDIAYGGMFYAIVDAKKLDLELLPHNGRRICRLGEMIKVACREQHPVNHPEFDYPGCDILVFTDLQRKDQGKMLGKNAVVMSNGRLSWDNPDSWTGMIDRSPCGTGTCAVMAQLHARGGLELSEEFVHESILGTHFVGELLEEVTIGPTSAPVHAVVPRISGRAWITQRCEIVCDPSDPFPQGYTIGDIWSANE
ncbi:unnamed protein product [Durusdinium trenchii]|uniref:Proline racemase n=1 Tax=Durusdinium trenchii TaxID=1381693 RepID=A0ABP0HDD5_9DINO